jgi:hypothetical protein
VVAAPRAAPGTRLIVGSWDTDPTFCLRSKKPAQRRRPATACTSCRQYWALSCQAIADDILRPAQIDNRRESAA